MVGRNMIEHFSAHSYVTSSPNGEESNLLVIVSVRNYICVNKSVLIIHAAGLFGSESQLYR